MLHCLTPRVSFLSFFKCYIKIFRNSRFCDEIQETLLTNSFVKPKNNQYECFYVSRSRELVDGHGAGIIVHGDAINIPLGDDYEEYLAPYAVYIFICDKSARPWPAEWDKRRHIELVDWSSTVTLPIRRHWNSVFFFIQAVFLRIKKFSKWFFLSWASNYENSRKKRCCYGESWKVL